MARVRQSHLRNCTTALGNFFASGILALVTADFVYVRLHGSSALYVSDYTDEELERWATKVKGWVHGEEGRDVYVYFDNDAKVHAPRNAMQLADLVASR